MKVRFTPKYVVALFAAVTLGFFGIVGWLVLCHRNAVWFGDELFQYVNYMLYYGRTFRAAVRSLLAGNGFAFPTYTLSNGYGMDTYILLGGTVTDLFNLPAIFCPGTYVEYCYVGMILVRLYVCAFAFSYYCLRRGNSQSSAMVASLCYTFAGCLAFQGAIRHPFFLTSAAYLPLILAGIDKVFDNESPRLFVVAMTLQLLASTYFSYMACLTMLGYCVIKYFLGTRDRSVKDFFLLVWRFILLLALSFCIAGITMLPRVLSLLSQKRLGLHRYKGDIFSVGYYLRMPSALVSVSSGNSALCYGAVGVLLLFVFVVCIRRFRVRERIVGLLCLTFVLVGLLFPIVGRAFNGFSYETSRWLYIADFACSYIVCRTVPILKDMELKEWARVLALVTLLCMLGYVGLYLVTDPSAKMVLGLVFLVGLAAWSIPVSSAFGDRGIAWFLSLYLLASLTITSGFYILPYVGSEFAGNFVKLGKVYSRFYKDSYAAAMYSVDDDEELYRYSAAKVYGSVRNASLNLGTSGIDFYKSTYNQFVDDFRTEIGLSDDPFNIRFFGSDSRLAIESLTGSKYFITKKRDSWQVPYGYEFVTKTKKGYQVWRSTHFLPLAFTTSTTISRDAYDSLTFAGKQEALVQGCVVEDEAAKGMAPTEPTIASHEIPCTVTGGSGVTVEDDKLTVIRSGATVTLTFEGEPACETYVQIHGLDYDMLTPLELAEMRGTKIGVQQIRANLAAGFPAEYNISFKGLNGKKKLDFCSNRHPQYGGKHDWLVNMGYLDEAQSQVTLVFHNTGVYSYKDISVVLQPVTPLVESIDALAEGGATDVSFDGRKMRMSFDTTDETSWAVITVPYAAGWKATVDGKAAEIVPADTAFMAVKLSGAGAHEVELRYFSPNLLYGSAISLVGILICIGLEVFKRRRAKAAAFEIA